MTTTMYCAQHPDVETELRCGRCEKPICPRCMVHTPGGIRCPECAQLRRPVMYELSGAHYARAIGTSLAVGVALGVVGAFLAPPGLRIPFFGLMLAIFAGLGAGALMAEALGRATKYKRGLQMQVIAGAGIALAWALRLLIAEGTFEVAPRDLMGLIMLAAGIFSAAQRLR